MLNRQENNQIRDLIKSKNIKVTLPRMWICQILKHATQGLTAHDIENLSVRYNNRMNLTTIYTTLRLFQNVGLVNRHKIDSAQATYTLVQSDGNIRIASMQGVVQVLEDIEITRQIEQLCRHKQLKLQSYSLTINVHQS
jgi:Fur family ferric uptake transcriptional regulator